MLVRLYGCSLWHYYETWSLSKVPDPVDLTVFLPLLQHWSLSLRCKSCIIDVSIYWDEMWLHNYAIWFTLVFCNRLHLLQREVSWCRGTFLSCTLFMHIPSLGGIHAHCFLSYYVAPSSSVWPGSLNSYTCRKPVRLLCVITSKGGLTSWACIILRERTGLF